MGGTALGYTARRLTTNQTYEMRDRINSDLPHLNVMMPLSYRNKADHGDLDLVCIGTIDAIRAAVRTKYNPTDEKSNGHVYSFGLDGAQVDMISTLSPSAQLMQYHYMCWNDLGNLMGRTARSMGFKYGHTGLSWVVRVSDHIAQEVHISADADRIFEFLGYDPVTFHNGFDSLEDIYEYVTSSKYFNSLYYSVENRSHRDNARDRKRTTYQGMIKYIEQHSIDPRPKLTEEERLDLARHASDVFDIDILAKADQARAGYLEAQRLKKRLNGDTVRAVTGLEGKDVARVLTAISEKYNLDYLRAHMTDEDIRRIIQEAVT